MKWPFPSGTSIPGKGFLVVVVVVVAAGNAAAPNTLQAKFSLSKNGEYFALTDPLGNVIDTIAPEYPKQFLDHSYGRDASNAFVYFDAPAPSSANSNVGLIDRADRPDFSVAPGFYEGTLSLAITSQTPTRPFALPKTAPFLP